MQEIGVVIAGGRKRMFWQALEQALGKEPGVRVHRVGWLRSVDRLLRSQCPQVLLIEVQSGEAVPNLQRYLEQCPDLLIIGLDPECADVFVQKKNVGLHSLVSLIRTLAD